MANKIFTNARGKKIKQIVFWRLENGGVYVF